MKSTWLKGIGDFDEKENMKSAYKASGKVREKLTEIIEDKVKAADSSMISREGYSTPNWAYTQADLCGYKRALREVASLIGE